MSIKGNTQKLKERIVEILKKAKISVPVNIDNDGNINYDDVDFVSETSAGNIVRFDNASKPTYGENYTTNKGTGLEKIAEAISNEVLSYVVENADVNLKERLDALENDYNALIIALNVAGGSLVALPLTPVGTALTSVAVAGGGIGRQMTTTDKLKSDNEETDIG